MAPLNNRSHKAVARLRAARDGRDSAALFVEGRRLVTEFLETGRPPLEVAVTRLAGADPVISGLLDTAARRGAEIHWVTADIMSYISDLETPPGIIVRAERPPSFSLASLKTLGTPTPLVVLLDGLQLPANVGAVLRSAEAGGVTTVGILPGTADPLSPKALRASSGSAFRVPIFRAGGVKEVTTAFPGSVSTVVANIKGQRSYTEWDWTVPCVLIMGGEARGVDPKSLDTVIPQHIKIPMAGKVESLNVAVAAGILLMEARRQRTSASVGDAQA